MSGISCGVTAIVVYSLLLRVGIGNSLSTLVAVAAGAAVYAAVLLLSKGIMREDILMMPKGEKICAVMDKYNLLEKQG